MQQIGSWTQKSFAESAWIKEHLDSDCMDRILFLVLLKSSFMFTQTCICCISMKPRANFIHWKTVEIYKCVILKWICKNDTLSYEFIAEWNRSKPQSGLNPNASSTPKLQRHTGENSPPGYFGDDTVCVSCQSLFWRLGMATSRSSAAAAPPSPCPSCRRWRKPSSKPSTQMSTWERGWLSPLTCLKLAYRWDAIPLCPFVVKSWEIFQETTYILIT